MFLGQKEKRLQTKTLKQNIDLKCKPCGNQLSSTVNLNYNKVRFYVGYTLVKFL